MTDFLPHSFAPGLPLALMAASALLVLPLALLAYWVAVAERGGERAWFAFVVRCQLFVVASLFLDVPAALGLGDALGSRSPLAGALGALAALVHLSAAAFAGRRVRRRLRGATGSATSLRATLHSLLARLSPIVGLLGTLLAIRAHEFRAAGLSALAGFGLGLWFALRPARVLGLAPEAVTAGPLRERVFALGARAGVKIEQLFVLAARESQLVNAFAMQGRRVLVTDTLLERLSRREVDAVIAHELAHLRFRHPQLLFGGLLASCFVAFPLALPLGPWAFALAGIVAWLVVLMLSRSFEWAADRQAVAWTGDVEALVTAIARITRSNDIPLDWGPWTGLVLTHPPTHARALALARGGALSAERAEQLLLAPPEGTDERWPYDLNTATPIAGSVARTRSLLSSAWGSLAASTLAATLVVALARVSPVRWPGGLIVLAGGAAGWAAMLLVFDRLGVRGYRTWRAPLASRLQPDARAHYVGLSPGVDRRLYEGTSDWDVGFLAIDPRGIEYRGERARFTLPRERIVAIARVPGLPAWIPVPRIAVRWRTETGAEHQFTVRDADARSVHAIAAANDALADELRRALATPNDSGVLAMPAGAPPDPAQVTSQDPWRLAGWRTLPSLVVPVGLLACAAALLAGLPFWPWAGPGAFEVFGAGICTSLLMRAPYLVPRRRVVAEARALDRAA